MDEETIKVNVNIPGLPKHVKQDIETLADKAKKRALEPMSKKDQDEQELKALRRSVESQHAIIKALRHNAVILSRQVAEAEIAGAKKAFRLVYDIPLDDITKKLCGGWGEFDDMMTKLFERDFKKLL